MNIARSQSRFSPSHSNIRRISIGLALALGLCGAAFAESKVAPPTTCCPRCGADLKSFAPSKVTPSKRLAPKGVAKGKHQFREKRSFTKAYPKRDALSKSATSAKPSAELTEALWRLDLA
jgi:hypothetical protein